MIPDLKRFAQLGRDIVAERGPFDLLALLEREDHPCKWDLIVSAPWVKGVTVDDMGYVLDKMRRRLTSRDRDTVAHIILLRPDERTVQTILRASRPVTGATDGVQRDLNQVFINGMLIARGYILSAPVNTNSTWRTSMLPLRTDR